MDVFDKMIIFIATAMPECDLYEQRRIYEFVREGEEGVGEDPEF